MFGVNYLAYNYFKYKLTGNADIFKIRLYYNEEIDINKYIEEIYPELWIYKLLTHKIKNREKDKIKFVNNAYIKIFGIFYFLFLLSCLCIFFIKIQKLISISSGDKDVCE